MRVVSRVQGQRQEREAGSYPVGPARRSRVHPADDDPGAAGGELVRARGVLSAGGDVQDLHNAKTDNIREGVALSVECDQNPSAARDKLEALLGPATVVVESGGEWTNPETGEIEPKVHLHWRLKKPAATVEELAMLYEARALAATLVGGDRTNISIVHPMRWPGSWHCKKTPKLARIAALSPTPRSTLKMR